MKIYAQLNTSRDQIIKIGTIKDIDPRVSTFADGVLSKTVVDFYNLLELETYEDYNCCTQRKIDCTPYLKDGKAYSYRIEEIPEAEIIEAAWDEIRQHRNFLLSECDWTVQPDAPTDAEAWKVYRQALRDITQEPDPRTLTWPDPPFEFVKT